MTALPGSTPVTVSPAGGETTGEGVHPGRVLLDGEARVQRGCIWTPDQVISDAERALRLIDALAPQTGELRTTVIAGEPASKHRPRFRRNGRPYRTKEDIDAERRTAEAIRRIFREPWTGNVALGCVFFRPNRQRIDTDNMIKHVCDAATGIAWVDDSQVTAVYGITELDAARPRTIVAFAHHLSSLNRGSDDAGTCSVCGASFKRAGRDGHVRLTCSQKCARTARGLPDLSALLPCDRCGTPFRRLTSTQRFCGTPCARAAQVGQPRRRQSNYTRCPQCGTQLTHNRGGRCRECWRSAPKGQPDPVQAELEIGP